jgi:hypothetical protein
LGIAGNPTSGASVGEHAAIAPIREYGRLLLAQLVLPAQERDLTVFEHLFTAGRHRGVVANITNDVGAMVLEVQRNENSYEVVEDGGDTVVVNNRMVQEYVWSDPVEPQPYLMTGRVLFRFDMVFTSDGWRIADFVAVTSRS